MTLYLWYIFQVINIGAKNLSGFKLHVTYLRCNLHSMCKPENIYDTSIFPWGKAQKFYHGKSAGGHVLNIRFPEPEKLNPHSRMHWESIYILKFLERTVTFSFSMDVLVELVTLSTLLVKTLLYNLKALQTWHMLLMLSLAFLICGTTVL